MAKNITPAEFEALIRQIKWLIVGFVALCVLPLVIYAYQMDRRLSSFEDSLRYRPPQESAGEEPLVVSDMHHLATDPILGQVVYVPAYSHI